MWTVAFMACSQAFASWLTCEELLLASGASVAEGYEECSPLIAVGSKEGLEGILRYLKSPGFDINHEFPIFGTHLMAAIHEYYSSEQGKWNSSHGCHP